jgi:hypothetical protein
MCVLRRTRRSVGGKGVKGLAGYFMGYYTIWLALVKRFFVPFWELQKMSGVVLGQRTAFLLDNVPSAPN